MQEFILSLEPIVHWLFTTSLKATVIIALIIIVRLIFRDRLPAKWQHALWFLLIIRLVLPFEFASPLSVFNLTKNIQTPVKPYFGEDGDREKFQFDRGEDNRHRSVALNSQQIISTIPILETEYKLNWIDGLVLGWLIGVFILLIYALYNNVKMSLKLNRAREIIDSRLLLISARCYAKLKISKNIRMLISPEFQTPISCGLFKPSIIFPEYLLRHLSETEIEHILLHELVHIKRHDLPIAALTLFLQILYWFNPVVWFAFFKMRQDREMACDEQVLANLTENQSTSYGQTLISLLRHKPHVRLLPVAVGLADDPSNLKRRVTMIANFSKKSIGWSLVAVLLILVIAACALTGSEKKYNVSAKVIYNGETQPDSAWVGIYSLRMVDNNKIYSMGEPYDIVKCANECEFTLAPGIYAIAAWAWNYDRGYKNIVIVDKDTKLDIALTLDPQYIFGDYESVHLYGDFNAWTHDDAPIMTKDGDIWKITPPTDLKVGAFYKFLLKLKEPIDGVNYQNLYSPAITAHRTAITYCTFDHVYDGRKEIVFDPRLLSRKEAEPKFTIQGGNDYADIFLSAYTKLNGNMDFIKSLYDISKAPDQSPEDIFKNVCSFYDEAFKDYPVAIQPLISEYRLYLCSGFHPGLKKVQDAYKDRKVDKEKFKAAIESAEFEDYVNYLKSSLSELDMESVFFTGDIVRLLMHEDYYFSQAPESVLEKLNVYPGYFEKQLLDFVNSHVCQASENILSSILGQTTGRTIEDLETRKKGLALAKQMHQQYPNSSFTKNTLPWIEIALEMLVGNSAPVFTIETIDGEYFDLAAQKGKFVFIDFWGTWCGPCRGELPNNKKLVESMPSDKFEFIGLARDSNKALKTYIEKENITYRNAILTEEIEQLFGVMAYPTTYLIDPDGNILAKNLRGENLTERVQEMMDQYYNNI